MKKILTILMMVITSLSIIGCNNNSSTKEEQYTTIIKNIEPIDIEIDETYSFYYILKANKGLTLTIEDENIASLNTHTIKGVTEGKTNLILSLEDKKQKVDLNVYSKGALQKTFSFSTERLARKRIVVFGDSVTYPASIGGQKTYYELFAEKYNMIATCNYAIGGSTGTHAYEGSNIYKEYKNGYLEIDGPSVIKKAYDGKELDNIDYAFIHYVHNDQYFIPPIENPLDAPYDVNSFDSCMSFKGSYRYMIKTLLLANPDMRIIILGPSYSEYDKSNRSPYGKNDYTDYRIACKEIAEEFGLTYIDLWDVMYPYFDAYDSHFYYNDTVHPSAEGHKIIADYIINFRESEKAQ